MTRRKFFQKLAKAVSAVIMGTWWLARKTVPRVFVRAQRPDSYPGQLKALKNISGGVKWSG